jgi:hypothetical protein
MITTNTVAMTSGKTDGAISYTTVSVTAFRSKNKGDEAIREAIHLCVSVIHYCQSRLGNRINFVSHSLGGLYSKLLAVLQEKPTK